MPVTLTAVRKTAPAKWLVVPRLLAGLPLLVFSVKHFADQEHFRAILTAAGAPLVGATAVAASAAELAAGVLLVGGLFARLGGLLGVATMVPAVLTTVKFMGLSEHPFVPPLPVPVAVLVCSAGVLWKGAGAYSLDAKAGTETA